MLSRLELGQCGIVDNLEYDHIEETNNIGLEYDHGEETNKIRLEYDHVEETNNIGLENA